MRRIIAVWSGASWESSMRNLSYVVVLLLAVSSPSLAQIGPTGTWRAQGVGPQPWTLVLRASGSKLTGAVSSCASISVDIYDGTVNGNTVTFKCQSLDADRIISFRGVIRGDEIEFTWTKQVRDGGSFNPPEGSEAAPAKGSFGASTPERFIAKRVQESGVELATAVNAFDSGVKVEGTLFLPPRVARVRSVLVVINYGIGGTFYSDPRVRELSGTLESALLLARITNIGQNSQIDVVRSAGVGGGDGLLKLLERFAQESGHQELKDLPLLLVGHSAAGSFTSTFAALHPQRTIAFVRYHSAGAGMLGADVGVLSQIPALLLVSGTDLAAALESAERSWKNGRSIGAPWTFGVEPDADHGEPESLKTATDLIVPWIRAVVDQRLSQASRPMHVVTDASAWMGNNQTREVASATTFPGSKLEASWLPDAQSARAWQAVIGPAK
jgi:pimeloyl-ACP methyl ester carboxylesterase